MNGLIIDNKIQLRPATLEDKRKVFDWLTNSNLTIEMIGLPNYPDAKIPIYGSEHAAGFDVYSINDYTIYPEETKTIETGIAMEIPEGKVIKVWDRGGMGIKGIHRFAGVIDADYRGEFKIVLHNHNRDPYKIKKGDRIAQCIITDYYKANFQKVNELSDTVRGEGWNHSTGKN